MTSIKYYLLLSILATLYIEKYGGQCILLDKNKKKHSDHKKAKRDQVDGNPSYSEAQGLVEQQSHTSFVHKEMDDKQKDNIHVFRSTYDMLHDTPEQIERDLHDIHL